MIHEVEGDILLTRAQVIAHGVAPNDDFKNGLALALRERWPALYKDFRHYCQTFHPKPGELWTWGGVGGIRIVNLLTQEAASLQGSHPGNAHLPYVNHALKGLHKVIEEERFKSVAIPRLATGVGSLPWNDVFPLIQNHLGKLDIPVFVYSTYKPGIAAKEPGMEG